MKWDVRDAVTVRVPGIGRFWVRIKTKELPAMEVILITRPSQFNAARFEGIGRDVTVDANRHEGCDLVIINFVSLDQLNPKLFQPILKEHVKGFRELRGE